MLFYQVLLNPQTGNLLFSYRGKAVQVIEAMNAKSVCTKERSRHNYKIGDGIFLRDHFYWWDLTQHSETRSNLNEPWSLPELCCDTREAGISAGVSSQLNFTHLILHSTRLQLCIKYFHSQRIDTDINTDSDGNNNWFSLLVRVIWSCYCCICKFLLP